MMMDQIIVYGFMVLVLVVLVALPSMEQADTTKFSAVVYEIKVAVRYFNYRLKSRGLL